MVLHIPELGTSPFLSCRHITCTVVPSANTSHSCWKWLIYWLQMVVFHDFPWLCSFTRGEPSEIKQLMMLADGEFSAGSEFRHGLHTQLQASSLTDIESERCGNTGVLLVHWNCCYLLFGCSMMFDDVLSCSYFLEFDISSSLTLPDTRLALNHFSRSLIDD